MKRILCLVLSLLMLMSVAPMVANAADVYVFASGSKGENLEWKLYSDGTLAISGSGDMLYEPYNTRDWKHYYDVIKKVEIKNGITSLCKDAFTACYFTEISIPDSVISIDEEAFQNCSNLPSITLPNGIKAIKDGTFEGCSALKSIIIPDGTEYIGSFAFSGCYALSEISIPESVSGIGEYAFSFCNSLSKITVLNSDCDIFDSASTIKASAVIYGYTNSTAHIYAEKYNREFVALDGMAEEPTPENPSPETPTPEVPSPEEPTPEDPTIDCSCNCHKSGFMGFIWKILRIFFKLFKTNPVCACGAAHY